MKDQQEKWTKAIAIIGMAVKLPEAEHYEEFWQNLLSGRESVRELPASRRSLYPIDAGVSYARFGYIEGIDQFDPVFFKTLPAAAPSIDPAQRLILTVTNDAIEDAGYHREQWSEKRVGVFLSDHTPEYYKYLTEAGLDTLAGNLPANLAGRIAYCNGFTGPALTIDTACSSALVALHVAIESLRSGDSEVAIVGGASIKIDLPEEVESSIGVMSPTGQCRPFDVGADGTVGGEGVIAIILKPLDEALADGDQIHAVIRGSAVNQDGSRSNGLTAPSPVAQKEVIQGAWQNAGIDPRSISYIETHGTATRLGDPIEITGLSDAFRDYTAESGFCPLGAVKANIGHLGNLAGLVGLVKTVLALKYRQIPPMANFTETNPFIDFTAAPVYVNREVRSWDAASPLRAGVSSFGLSGTNCHVILEESPLVGSLLQGSSAVSGMGVSDVRKDDSTLGGLGFVKDYHRSDDAKELSQTAQLIALSASCEEQLERKVERLRQWLLSHPDISLADTAFTLLKGRKHFADSRFAVAALQHGDLLEKMEDWLKGSHTRNLAQLQELSAIFLIPDYDSVYAHYYDDLAETRLADKWLEECRQCGNITDQPEVAYFAFAYGLVQLMMEIGLKPQSIIGLGIGELVSGVIAKRLSLAEAISRAANFGERAEFKAEKLRQFIETQLAKGRNLFIHLASESPLSTEISKCIIERKGVYLFHAYGAPKALSLIETLAELYRLGQNLHWNAVLQGRRATLPGTFYEEKSYWFDVETARSSKQSRSSISSKVDESIAREVQFGGVSTIHDASAQLNLEEIAKGVEAIWQARLGLTEINRDDDFIELGGDSIRAMFLMNDIKEQFGVTLDLAYLLQYGSINALSTRILEELSLMTAEKLMTDETVQESYSANLFQSSPVHSNEQGLNMLQVKDSDDSLKLSKGQSRVSDSFEGTQTKFRDGGSEGIQAELRDDVDGSQAKSSTGRSFNVTSAKQSSNITSDIPPAIPKLVRDGIAYYNLSPSQKNLWLVHQLDPKEIAYNEPMALILKGPLRIDYLTKALQRMVERHASLRTFFTLQNGEPMQGVYDTLPVNIPEESLDAVIERLASGIEAEEIRRQFAQGNVIDHFLEKVVHSETAIPFEMRQAPLLRTRLIRLRDEEYLLIMVAHHIIFDGWSILIFMKEICQLYEAYVEEQADPLPMLPLQYYDFAHWQKHLLESGANRSSEEFWLQKLEGELPQLNLPTDFPRPVQKNYEGSSLYFKIPTELSARIKELSKETGTTLFATMLAFFEILLYKYTRSEEFVIGTPSANRPHPGLWGLIGFFVNTFTIRQRVEADASFKRLLEGIKADLLESFPHKEYPFTELVSKLNRKRDPGRAAIFDVMYVFHNVGSIHREDEKILMSYGGIDFQELRRREIVSDFDLKMEFEEAPEHFNGKIEFSTRLFKNETIERMVGHLLQIMETVVSNPDQKLSQISLLTQKERTQILDEFNGREMEYLREETVPTLWQKQVSAAPDSIAVIHHGERLTYREFFEHVQTVAGRLREHGVNRETIVAIMAKRSLEMLVGVYAVMQAGGAYLPIDPDYPEERISFILADSQAKLLLTHEPTAERGRKLALDVLVIEEMMAGSAPGSARMARPDEANPNISDSPSTQCETDDHKTLPGRNDEAQLATPCNVNRPNDLAYVIYTSGSTGVPKGVMIEHQALSMRMQYYQSKWPLDDTDTILLKTAFTFDVSVPEIFWWVLGGAKVAILEVDGEKSPQTLLETIEAHQVTVTHFVPSMLSVFLNYLERYPTEVAKLASWRFILTTGEAIKKATVREFQRLIGDANSVKLYNVYGPTEATIEVSHFDCSEEFSGENVPIGQPMANTKLVVVDDALQMLPIGIPGEIGILGEGLARGYLNRPDLTQEKFVENRELGQRMYRTGDLGRYLSNGNIEFLGRFDYQVKVRGYRIELGEIEAVLTQHPAIRDAVVLVREDSVGQNELIAYLVAHADKKPTISELRTSLANRLPEYMLPGFFIFLDSMPLLPNGKADRKALSLLQINHATTPVAPTIAGKPRNELERKLSAIWAALLQRQEVGIYENFFELGGDSIKAIQVGIELSQMGIELQVQEIVQHQTIDELATYIMTQGLMGKETDTSTQALRQQSVEGEMLLTPIQRWFMEQHLQTPGHWNQSLLLNLTPEVELELLAEALLKLLEHHDALRLIYHAKTESLFHRNQLLRRQVFDLPHYDLSGLTREEQNQRLAELGFALKASIDLETGPLLKACTFDLGERGRRLLLTIHHLVVDGISWRILLLDLLSCYQQLANDAAVTLPAKTDSFKSWGEMLDDYSQRRELLTEVQYWENVQHKWKPLPRDFAMTQVAAVAESDVNDELILFRENCYGTEAKVMGELTPELTRLLLTDVHSAYNTNINDLLFTALAQTIARWTGYSDVSFEVESHGRHVANGTLNINRTVGWFTSLYPITVTIDHTDEVSQLKSVKETFRQIPEDGIGYGVLRYLRGDLQGTQSPEMVFNYLGQLDEVIPAGPFGIAAEFSGADRALDNQRSHVLEIVAAVVQRKLTVTFYYSTDYHLESTIENLVQGYLANLESIIHCCTDGGSVGYTPSDFTLAGLDQETLDQLSSDLESLLEGIE